MATLTYGATREVWFAKLADPATKWSFLIRDDTYSRSGAIFGRTLRLGDPIDLGPNSTWKQEGWEGGRDQTIWRDPAMYEKGTIDSTTTTGKVKLWRGFRRAHGANNRAVTRYTLSPGASGIGSDTPLYMGEANLTGRIDPTTGTAVPPGGFEFSRYNPATATVTAIKSDFPASINSITRWADPPSNTQLIMLGLGNGQVYNLNISSGVITLENTDKGVEVDSMVGYNEALYYGAGNTLRRRTNDGTTKTFSNVKEFYGALTVRGLAVWNNRLWFSAVSTGSLTQVFVTDGTTVTPAFTFPQAFEVRAVAVHYGALYFAGDTGAGTTSGSYVGQIWRYTGSSLTKIYEQGTGNDARQHVFWDLTSWGKYLAWGRPGLPETGRAPGVMLFDAEADAIIDGPTFDMDGSATTVAPGSLHVWNNTLVGSWYDHTNYNASVNGPTAVAFLKTTDAVRHTFTGGGMGGRSFEAQPAELRRYCLSSRFDGGIPGESKVWLTGRVRAKIPHSSAQVLVYMLLDESTTENLVAIIDYDAANTGWRTISFALKVGSSYAKSTTIQYKMYLLNTDSANNDSAHNPEVDSIEFNYMPSPKKRRAWRMRVVASEAQTRLDGSANNLTTTTAIIDKLEELWSEQQPILFWDAGTAGGVPGGAGTEVMLSDYVSQPFRLDSTTNDLGAEIAFGLTEVVG